MALPVVVSTNHTAYTSCFAFIIFLKQASVVSSQRYLSFTVPSNTMEMCFTSIISLPRPIWNISPSSINHA